LSGSDRYNIAPSQEVPVIVQNEGVNELKPMKWGLVPSWAPDPSTGDRMINARAETITEKPSFKRLVQQRRCLIPADGFYEWRREGNGKVPIWIHLKKMFLGALIGIGRGVFFLGCSSISMCSLAMAPSPDALSHSFAQGPAGESAGIQAVALAPVQCFYIVVIWKL
jgi:putative SOS response-associated peptidase YedK